MLADLPTELLSQIISYSPTASISRLSQSSHALHAFVEKEGWRTFAQTNFPSLKYPPYWKDAVHSLTTLSRNWQRRAFIAQYLEPRGDITAVSTGLPVKNWRRPGGQTMGFQPAVDSYEQFVGGKWSYRREVVAWSAGAELVVRVRVRDAATEAAYRGASHQERRKYYEPNDTRTHWWSYRPFSAVEGRDDITSVNILKPDLLQGQGIDSGHVIDQIIIGTANGDLQLIQIPIEEDGVAVKAHFVTDGVSVRSTSLTPIPGQDTGSESLLVANLSDSKIALYKVDSKKPKTAPFSEINAIPAGRKGCRIWSTRFLDPKRLVVGLGPSVEPILVFEVRPEGFYEEPIRRICLGGDAGSMEPTQASSIYPIEPLTDANGGSGDGNLFISGGYDGIVRLHDLRSPSPYEVVYQDPTDDAAIYSLLSRGRDRFVAGTSRHCLLKIFDLRVSGGSQYDYAQVVGEDNATSSQGDWNIFINPRERYANASWRGPNSWMRRSAEGSVYSLSSPSPTSPFIYAGVENAVVEFNFSSLSDHHPDTVFSSSDNSTSTNFSPGHSSALFKSKHDVLNLAMYSQGTDGAKEAMMLRLQRGVDDTSGRVGQFAGLDERWKENQ